VDGLTALLVLARNADLKVAVVGDRLVVRGPKRAAALAKELIGRKPEVLEHLRARVEDDAAEVSARLAGLPGYVVVYSHVLDEDVIFIRDATVTVPEGLSGLVQYSLDELSILTTASAEALREIHRAKQRFGGQVQAVNATFRSSTAPGTPDVVTVTRAI
jgi:hypothetical protein